MVISNLSKYLLCKSKCLYSNISSLYLNICCFLCYTQGINLKYFSLSIRFFKFFFPTANCPPKFQFVCLHINYLKDNHLHKIGGLIVPSVAHTSSGLQLHPPPPPYEILYLLVKDFVWMMLFGLVWCCNFLSPLLDILHNDVSHKVVVQRKKGLTQSEEGRQIVVENERYSISSIFSLVKTLRFLIICPLTMLTFRQWVDNFENWTCSN